MPAETLSDRVTRLEVLMEDLARQLSRELEVAADLHRSMDKAVATLTTIVERQDGRLTSVERSIAKALGAVAIIVLLVTLFGPYIRRALNLPV